MVPFQGEPVPGTLCCSHCNVIVDVMPFDPMSPMNGFCYRSDTDTDIRFIDVRTGLVFHKCAKQPVGG